MHKNGKKNFCLKNWLTMFLFFYCSSVNKYKLKIMLFLTCFFIRYDFINNNRHSLAYFLESIFFLAKYKQHRLAENRILFINIIETKLKTVKNKQWLSDILILKFDLAVWSTFVSPKTIYQTLSLLSSCKAS